VDLDSGISTLSCALPQDYQIITVDDLATDRITVAARGIEQFARSKPTDTLGNESSRVAQNLNSVASGEFSVAFSNTDRQERTASLADRLHCTVIHRDGPNRWKPERDPQLSS